MHSPHKSLFLASHVQWDAVNFALLKASYMEVLPAFGNPIFKYRLNARGCFTSPGDEESDNGFIMGSQQFSLSPEGFSLSLLLRDSECWRSCNFISVYNNLFPTSTAKNINMTGQILR